MNSISLSSTPFDWMVGVSRDGDVWMAYGDAPLLLPKAPHRRATWALKRLLKAMQIDGSRTGRGHTTHTNGAVTVFLAHDDTDGYHTEGLSVSRSNMGWTFSRTGRSYIGLRYRCPFVGGGSASNTWKALNHLLSVWETPQTMAKTSA